VDHTDLIQVAEQTYDDGERIMARFWLIDPRLNNNGWRAPAASIVKNARSFVGKPLIHYTHCMLGHCEAHHATAQPGEPCRHTLEVQEPYRVGTIRNVEITSEAKAHAIVEIQDTEVRRMIDSGDKVFVSPAVCPVPGTVEYEGSDIWGRPNRILHEWEGMHLAIVDSPAYGPEAAIMAHCKGPDCDPRKGPKMDFATVRTLSGTAQPIKGPIDARRAGMVSMVRDIDQETMMAGVRGRAAGI